MALESRPEPVALQCSFLPSFHRPPPLAAADPRARHWGFISPALLRQLISPGRRTRQTGQNLTHVVEASWTPLVRAWGVNSEGEGLKFEQNAWVISGMGSGMGGWKYGASGQVVGGAQLPRWRHHSAGEMPSLPRTPSYVLRTSRTQDSSGGASRAPAEEQLLASPGKTVDPSAGP